MEEGNKIVVFQERQIRRTWHNEEWFFSVLDVVQVLTDSANPTDYFKKMRKRDPELHAFVGTNCPQVEMPGTGGTRKTLSANTENMFRIIQSIPSSKAEPFKRWLARVGAEQNFKEQIAAAKRKTLAIGET